MTRLLPALALLPWLALGVAAITRAGSPDPLPAPPAQDALPRAETLATVVRQGIVVRIDLGPPGADLPDVILWSDPSHGTRVYRLER